MKSMRIALSCVLLALADATAPPPSSGPTVVPPPTAPPSVTGSTPAPSEAGPTGTCDNPIDLDSMTSPYSGTTAGKADNFALRCGGRGSEQVFSITVYDGMSILIGQTENSWDTRHQMQWGGCGSEGVVQDCRDDPDTQEERWTNRTGDTQTFFYTIDSYYAGESGTFTLSWRITDWPYVQRPYGPTHNTFLANSAREGYYPNGSTSGLLMYKGKPVCDATFQRRDGVTACNEMGMVYVGHKKGQEMDAWSFVPTSDAPTDWPSSTGGPRRRLGGFMSSTDAPTDTPMDAGLTLGDLNCEGTEDGLADCSHNTTCDESDTGVKLFCAHRPQQGEGVSISEEGFLMYDDAYVCDDIWGINGAIGSGSFSSGSGRRRLEGGLYYGSEYDAGSSGDWWHGDYNLNVVCRELGLSSEGGTWVDSVQLPNGNFSMDDVDCEGHEERLSDCQHTTNHNCSSGEGIKVSCGAKLSSSEAFETWAASDGFCSSSENCGWMDDLMDRIALLETQLMAVASGGIWLDYCDMFVNKQQNKHYNKCEKMRVNDRYDQEKKENKCGKMDFCSWNVEDGADMATCNFICPTPPTAAPTTMDI